MERLFPVYTQEKECHDCYRCVRQCPVKAIRVKNERAYIIAERCVACGCCVTVCSSRAKHVRNDLGRARLLLQAGKPVYVSLAPSWVAVHSDWSEGQFVAALRRLGFAGVSETALGAEEVSASLAKELSDSPHGLHISSACPAVVDLIRKHLPSLVGNITPLASPALTHARLLRDEFGPDIGVVFIGPCAAKKTEADENPGLMNLAVTFAELDIWLAERNINPALLSPGESDVFVLRRSKEGGLYPLEGGMLETIRHYGIPDTVRTEAISGLERVKCALTTLNPDALDQPLFIEGLACGGGCVEGPCSTKYPAQIEGALAVRSAVTMSPPGPRPAVKVEVAFEPKTVPEKEWSEAEILEALSRIGKTSPDDELNCSACGYDTCRKLAKALLSGDAEITMCASYMRSIAQRKANALVRCMPSGVVIVGTDLRIVESNEAFANIFRGKHAALFENRTDLTGVDVEEIFPCGKLLRAALRSGEEIKRERMKMGDMLLDVTIFIIEKFQTVGAIVEDVTLNEMRRDQIARKAREVINRNVSTVQEIACRLGEHMADTEILLSSIAEGYGDDDAEAGK